MGGSPWTPAPSIQLASVPREDLCAALPGTASGAGKRLIHGPFQAPRSQWLSSDPASRRVHGCTLDRGKALASRSPSGVPLWPPPAHWTCKGANTTVSSLWHGPLCLGTLDPATGARTMQRPPRVQGAGSRGHRPQRAVRAWGEGAGSSAPDQRRDSVCSRVASGSRGASDDPGS